MDHGSTGSFTIPPQSETLQFLHGRPIGASMSLRFSGSASQPDTARGEGVSGCVELIASSRRISRIVAIFKEKLCSWVAS